MSVAPLLDKCEITLPQGVTPFVHINQNEGRKQLKQKEEDIAICECKYDDNDPDSACGERCLNVLTSTECTLGYCPCSDSCKNQRFQKCEYAETKLFRTEGRGWGLLADENIKAGQFIIEYCGEVISSKEAKKRSHTYEMEGLRDAYIISLNANYSIDATKKGSLARFINHSCQPNCETRKWNVLGETRVGIFAKQDISIGTELAYDYNFEWYGGDNVRCLCGAPNCSIFLGAKSQGFQEHNHVWEDGDDRYEVDEIPIYDSAEDEPSSKLAKCTGSFKLEPVDSSNSDYSVKMDAEHPLGSTNLIVGLLNSIPDNVVSVDTVKTEYTQDTQQGLPQTNGMAFDIESSSAWGHFNNGGGPSSPRKSAQNISNNKSKVPRKKQVSGERVARLFASKEVQEEIIRYEEIKKEAETKLDHVYEEIRGNIEEHERDSQDSVPTADGVKWIKAMCSKYRADFNFNFCIVKNTVCPPEKKSGVTNASEGGGRENAGKELTN